MLSKIIYDTYNLSEKGIPEHYLLNIKRLCEESGCMILSMTHDDGANDANYKRLEVDKSRYEGGKVILLLRDPRDTIVSYYFHRTKRWKPIDDPGISTFIRDKRYGIRKLLRFYNIWDKNIRKTDSALVLRYEDMHTNAYNVISRILTFMDIAKDVPEKYITNAIEFAQFENLKKLEKENFFHTHKMRPADLNDDETFKVRRGVVYGYHDYLDVDDIEFLNRVILKNSCSFLNYYKEVIKFENPIKA